MTPGVSLAWLEASGSFPPRHMTCDLIEAREHQAKTQGESLPEEPGSREGDGSTILNRKGTLWGGWAGNSEEGRVLCVGFPGPMEESAVFLGVMGS